MNIEHYITFASENFTAQSFFVCFLITLVLLVICIPLYRKGIIEKSTYIELILFVFYCSYLIYLTIICREPGERYIYHFNLFWSYQAVFKGAYIRLVEISGNILLFVPIGMLLKGILKKKRFVMILGVLLSCSIECIQLITKRGTFVLDDIIHNTIGLIIGVLIFLLVHRARIK